MAPSNPWYRRVGGPIQSPEASGRVRKAPNEPNWNRPLIACSEGVNVDGFGPVYAERTQFRGLSTARHAALRENRDDRMASFLQRRSSRTTAMFHCEKSKLWQGLLTLPPRRPEVSSPAPAGDLRSGRAPGTGWAGSGDPRRAAPRPVSRSWRFQVGMGFFADAQRSVLIDPVDAAGPLGRSSVDPGSVVVACRRGIDHG